MRCIWTSFCVVVLGSVINSQTPHPPPPLASTDVRFAGADPGRAFWDMNLGKYRLDATGLSAPPGRYPVVSTALRREDLSLDCSWWSKGFDGPANFCMCVSYNPEEPAPVPDARALKNATFLKRERCPLKETEECDVFTMFLSNNTEWLYYEKAKTHEQYMLDDYLVPILVDTIHPAIRNVSIFDIPAGCDMRNHTTMEVEPQHARELSTTATVSAHRCISEKRTGTSRYFCDHVGYVVVVPTSCMEGGCGMVVDIHGFTMSADQQDKNTEMRMRGLAHNYVVVQPEARGQSPGTTWHFHEDAPHVLNVTQELIRLYAIDSKRVHLQGLSEGGQMTWMLYCEAPHLWASLGPMVMNADSCFKTAKEVRALPPVPVIYLDGIHDALNSFQSTNKSVLALQAGWDLGAATIVARGPHFTHLRYQGATANDVVEFIYHDMMAQPYGPLPIWGHCFLGSPDVAPRTRAFGQAMHFGCPQEGPSKEVYPAMDIMWQFIADHPKP